MTIAEKCWTDNRDNGVNNSCIGSEPTSQKLSSKYFKQADQAQYEDCMKKKVESIDHLESSCPILTLIEYKERHDKIEIMFIGKWVNTMEHRILKNDWKISSNYENIVTAPTNVFKRADNGHSCVVSQYSLLKIEH